MRQATLFSLKGRTALVTGGSSGIGYAIARALGYAGARILLVARREDVLCKARVSMEEEGIETYTLPCDLGSAEGALSCAKEALELYERLHIAVDSRPVFNEPCSAADRPQREFMFYEAEIVRLKVERDKLAGRAAKDDDASVQEEPEKASRYKDMIEEFPEDIFTGAVEDVDLSDESDS